MNIPQLSWLTTLSDLPEWRAGGHIYLVTSGEDGGVTSYFAAKGYTLDRMVVSDSVLNDYCGVMARVVHEATRLVCAVGGYACMEAAKLIAHHNKLPLWCLPTDYDAVSALRCHSLWVVDAQLQCVHTPEHQVFAVETLLRNKGGAHQAYAHLFGYYVSLCCEVYANQMHNRKERNLALSPMADIQNALRHTQYAVGTGKDLWGMLWQAAQVVDESEIQRLSYTIYLCKRGSLSYNKYEFAAAFAVACALQSTPDAPDLALPPDRMTVRQRMVQLGLGNSKLQPMPEADYARLEWVWRDYLPDTQHALGHLPVFAKNWRRLVDSAGYGYFEDLQVEEIVHMLPVAAELSPHYTPLRHLYWRGSLNPFIT